MDPTTALTPDDLAAMTNALTLDDSAEIARLRRVAAGGKVGEEAGKEARREAAWRLGLYYGARQCGKYIIDDYVTMRQDARDFDASLKHLMAAALDGHAEASFNLYTVTCLKEKYEAKEAGVLRTGNASKQLHWLRRAADGGHIHAMMILCKSILFFDKDHDDFIKQTLEMTEKDGLSYLQKTADRNCGDAFIILVAFCCVGHGAGVDRDFSRAEKLLDESEKPETFWLKKTIREEGRKAIEGVKRIIIYERLLRGGDEDAKGYSFVHDALKIPPDHKMNFDAKTCVTCMKAVPEVAKLKSCKACRSVYYCSKECQRAHWPLHKRECPWSCAADRGRLREWYGNCPGLHAAAILAAYINRNATPVILIRTELGDDGLHPVVTIVPKRELMNFHWGCRVSQEPSFQKSEGAASVFVYVMPFHLGKVFAHGICFDLKNIGNRESDVIDDPIRSPLRRRVEMEGGWFGTRRIARIDDPITEWMTTVAWNTGRAAEVREHTNLERPPRPL